MQCTLKVFRCRQGKDGPTVPTPRYHTIDGVFDSSFGGRDPRQPLSTKLPKYMYCLVKMGIEGPRPPFWTVPRAKFRGEVDEGTHHSFAWKNADSWDEGDIIIYEGWPCRLMHKAIVDDPGQASLIGGTPVVQRYTSAFTGSTLIIEDIDTVWVDVLKEDFNI